jgi:predicted cobalt transporter CbtA
MKFIKKELVMMKRTILAIIAVFILWSILDFVIHGVILNEPYQATADLWRPMEEMKMGLMYVTGLIYSICFVLIYALLVKEKSTIAGLKYGLLFGLAVGVSMGYGSYSVMPVPYSMAFIWFMGSVVEVAIGPV